MSAIQRLLTATPPNDASGKHLQAILRGAFAFISESMAAWAITAAIRGSVAATPKTWPPLSDEPQSLPGKEYDQVFQAELR